MTYSTLLVHLDGARSNAAVLAATATLASHFQAKVIGVAACQPIQLAAYDGYMEGALAAAARDIAGEQLAHAKLEFHAHAGLRPHALEWRSIPAPKNVTQVVAELARCADLVVTGVGPTSGAPLTHADTGDLILRAGCPVLVVPDTAATADFRHVIVGWTDTRESRRAIRDALPILHTADRVTIVAASRDALAARDGIDDIAAWLGRHGIGTDRVNSRMTGSAAETLAGIAKELDADLIVAGAYGHSRIREWAFGGVTRDLLLHEQRCTLLSH